MARMGSEQRRLRDTHARLAEHLNMHGTIGEFTRDGVVTPGSETASSEPACTDFCSATQRQVLGERLVASQPDLLSKKRTVAERKMAAQPTDKKKNAVAHSPPGLLLRQPQRI